MCRLVRLSPPDSAVLVATRPSGGGKGKESGETGRTGKEGKKSKLNTNTNRQRKVRAARVGSFEVASEVHVEQLLHSLWCQHIIVTLRRERQSRGKGLLPVC